MAGLNGTLMEETCLLDTDEAEDLAEEADGGGAQDA